MKALVLAGGRGKRLEKYSEDINKCMLIFQGKPLIEHSLEKIIELPVDEIIILVGYRAEDIINTYGINYKGRKIQYIIQQEQHGLVNAIECCEEIMGGHDFMLFLGDEIMVDPNHKTMLDSFYKNNVSTICGVVEVDDKALISKTYSIIFDDEFRIYRLVEKPQNPFNNIMGTGNCIFKNEIFSYIPSTPINQKRNEKELPDLIQCLIDDGKIVKAFYVCKKYVNINTEDDISIVESVNKNQRFAISSEKIIK